MELLVDPVLFAVPSINGNEEVYVQYIENLSRWSDEFREQRHSFFVAGSCIQALYDADCYPDPLKLKQLLARMDEKVIASDIVFAAFQRVIMNTPHLEDRVPDLGLSNVEIKESDFSVRPDLLQRLPLQVAAAFLHTLVLLALAKGLRDDSVAELYLVTHPVEGEPHVEIEVHTPVDANKTNLSADVPIVTDPDDLDALVDLTQQWRKPTEAISWFMREMVREGALRVDTTLAPYVVSPTFIQSIERYHFERSPGRLRQIFRKCVLLLSENLPFDEDKHHTLSKNKQQFVGRWGAWRLHVTGSPLAIRLHYWRQGNRFILMHVVPHEEMGIDDPPSDAFA